MVGERVAVLLDGEFVKKVLRRRRKAFPTHADVLSEVERILTVLDEPRLYRIFYYTANPVTGKATHPLTKSITDFERTSIYSENIRLINRLENAPDVAVRRGTLVHQGWEIGKTAIDLLMNGTKCTVEARDVQPRIQQKGVDMCIGLDIATLALKHIVSTIVVVTGDSDLVPALKLARREGLRVYLDCMCQPVRAELKIHADRVL